MGLPLSALRLLFSDRLISRIARHLCSLGSLGLRLCPEALLRLPLLLGPDVLHTPYGPSLQYLDEGQEDQKGEEEGEGGEDGNPVDRYVGVDDGHDHVGRQVDGEGGGDEEGDPPGQEMEEVGEHQEERLQGDAGHDEGVDGAEEGVLKGGRGWGGGG